MVLKLFCLKRGFVCEKTPVVPVFCFCFFFRLEEETTLLHLCLSNAL